MKRIYLTLGCMLLGCGLSVKPAVADIEVVEIIPDVVQDVFEVYTKVENEYSTLKHEFDTAVQSTKGMVDTYSGMAKNITDPANIKDKIPETAKVERFGALKDFNPNGAQDDNAELVKDAYSGQFNEPLPERRRRLLQLNKKEGRDMARLYAKALILRQELLDEELEPKELKEIIPSLKASAELQRISLLRWNKILGMQAYLNEYLSSKQMKNFTRDGEEEEE